MVNLREHREKEKEQRSNYIIDAAERLFFAKGYDTVSMDDIAAEVGLSKAALYRYFKNKDSLFMHIVFRKVEEFGEYMSDHVGEGKTGLEKIRFVILCFVDCAKQNREYNDLVSTYGPAIFHRIGEEDLRKFRDLWGRYTPVLYGAIGEGQRDGSIRCDLDTANLGFFVHMITFFVVSPEPSWKQGYTAAIGSYDDLIGLYLAFIEPAIAGCPTGEKSTSPDGT
jgi:TetR/AcrR family transcriptional regulator